MPEDSIARLSAIAGLYGSFDECLDAAAEIAVGCEPMLDAIENLRRLYSLLQDQPYADKLRLDFSIVNDIDYYNGVIFQGYVKRVPRAVLSGGRYDNLLSRFGHDADAIGFALYLNEISSRYTEKTEYDVDAFILYSENDNFSAVLNAVNRLADCGNRVRAGKCVPDGLRCASVLRLENGNFKEVSPNA